MFQMENAVRMFLHRRTNGLHAKLVQLNIVVHLKGIFFNAEQGLKTPVFPGALIERHDGLTQPKEQPTGAWLPVF